MVDFNIASLTDSTTFDPSALQHALVETLQTVEDGKIGDIEIDTRGGGISVVDSKLGIVILILPKLVYFKV